jgi:hypothetical protein
MNMAKEEMETSLASTGSFNAWWHHQDAQPLTARSAQASNKAPPVLHPHTTKGQPAVVAAAGTGLLPSRND